jgi:hypothetical protein
LDNAAVVAGSAATDFEQCNNDATLLSLSKYGSLPPFRLCLAVGVYDEEVFVASTGFAVNIPQDRIQELHDLLSDLNKDLSGLAERARDVGYHRERMWLQRNPDGSGQLIVYLEFNEGVDPQDSFKQIGVYESEFTRWWNPRFNSLIGLSENPPSPVAETLMAWDDEA